MPRSIMATQAERWSTCAANSSACQRSPFAPMRPRGSTSRLAPIPSPPFWRCRRTRLPRARLARISATHAALRSAWPNWDPGGGLLSEETGYLDRGGYSALFAHRPAGNEDAILGITVFVAPDVKRRKRHGKSKPARLPLGTGRSSRRISAMPRLPRDAEASWAYGVGSTTSSSVPSAVPLP